MRTWQKLRACFTVFAPPPFFARRQKDEDLAAALGDDEAAAELENLSAVAASWRAWRFVQVDILQDVSSFCPSSTFRARLALLGLCCLICCAIPHCLEEVAAFEKFLSRFVHAFCQKNGLVAVLHHFLPVSVANLLLFEWQ
jgi:hypothetical protein